jgi:hypothetical protein
MSEELACPHPLPIETIPGSLIGICCAAEGMSRTLYHPLVSDPSKTPRNDRGVSRNREGGQYTGISCTLVSCVVMQTIDLGGTLCFVRMLQARRGQRGGEEC